MGIDCLLVSVNQVMEPYPVYPLGVAHLLGALQQAGHRADHFDLLAHGGLEGLAAKLADSSFDLIGLSIRNLDTLDSTASEVYATKALAVMDVVRQRSAAPVVLGGPAFSILPEEMLALLKADYGVVGEGEILLPWLAEQLGNGKIPAEKILRSTPDPAPWRPVEYEPVCLDYYLEWGGMINIQTKRGCPHRCSYCSYPSLEGRSLRLRDPEAVAADVMRAGNDLGAGYIFFADAAFNDPQGHYLQVAEALIRAGNKTPWCAFFRPQNLTRDGLELLKRSGLAAMEVGSDATTDTTLAAINKGFTFDDVCQVNDLAVSLEIPCAHFVIFGGPEENDQTVDEGLRNMDRLKHSVAFAFAGIRILPNTAIHDLAVSQNLLQPNTPLLEPVYYFSPEISVEGLDRRLKGAWGKRLDRVYPASDMQPRVRRLHQRGHIGPIWDLLAAQ